ncbi:MAG: hypothetical protein WC831_01755 [Parcubacteria group bacterium]|jgi:hypothetical protein
MSKKKIKKEIEMYVKCLKCGEEIKGDTNKKMIPCKCGTIEVDGCEFYIRIIGNKQDYKMIPRKLKNSTN